MTVLRKRSPWVIPAASVLFGALTLGLAGCGGDDTPFPINTRAPITIPAGVTPVTLTATRPTPVVTNQGATIESGTTNPNQTGGITGVNVIIPQNVVRENATLGVEVVPTSASIIEAIRRVSPTNVAGVVPVAEFAFGAIDPATGQIDVNRPVVFGGNVTVNVSLTPAQGQALQNALNNNNRLQVRRVTGTAGNQTLSVAEDCDATLTNVTTTSATISVPGNCSGHLVITQESTQHPQGGVRS